MPYDVKIGPHYIKTVIDDENLHKLSFFETKFLDVSIKHTGAHHPPMSQHFANFISIRTILDLD